MDSHGSFELLHLGLTDIKNRVRHCLQTLFLLYIVSTSVTKESFVTRTSPFLVDIFISIGVVSLSIALFKFLFIYFVLA